MPFFGHYICYIRVFAEIGIGLMTANFSVLIWFAIFSGVRVELEEVLSQGAYMLLYSRISARPSGLQTSESLRMPEEQRDEVEVKPGLTEQPESISSMETVTCSSSSKVLPSDISSDLKASASDNDSLTGKNSMDVDTVDG
ncbi:ubiquitin carboxyl-terminal hydrolase 19-like [Neltuma alba]|uniref:ubiquitin carboxyl-terminal hydrolase 19-like n=1 Tax=Neltuma alba TaxID=207710 RepID=UPI0010A3461D|nr:ubiquitin carboxyl-terminal hydrolase 19-like [Prosopis alba]